jgi:hypothetical protein
MFTTMTPAVLRPDQFTEGDEVGEPERVHDLELDREMEAVGDGDGDGDIQGNSTSEPGDSLDEPDPSPNAP